jgi:hypothetical protein
MSDANLPEDLKAAIEKYLELKRATHDAGVAVTKLMDDACQLPHDIKMMMLGDVFLSYVFQNGACKYLTDITINFQPHFEAWMIGQQLKQNVMQAIKLRGPDDWPEIVERKEG